MFQPSSGLATTPSPKTVGVCVAPQPGVEDTTYSALESILLNRHFGIKHFIFYDRGITSKFFAQLDRAKMKTDLNVSNNCHYSFHIKFYKLREVALPFQSL